MVNNSSLDCDYARKELMHEIGTCLQENGCLYNYYADKYVRVSSY